jgi:hypothetical protein
MSLRILVLTLLVTLFSPIAVFAQSFSAGAHFTSSRWSEFDGTDNGVGGRFTWMASSMIGIDADVTWYPSDFQGDGPAFSRSRVEGLFGATFGPRLNGIRPFAKATAGFLRVSPTGGAFACIAIFPPPLACQLAGGDTLAAFEIGGGIEADAGSRFFIRADAADRILRYPGPTLTQDFERLEDGYLGHAFRLTLGAGIKF